jgi:hypothetical protein
VVYSLFSYHQKNLGGPGSSKGKLERNRAGLTIYRGGREDGVGEGDGARATCREFLL